MNANALRSSTHVRRVHALTCVIVAFTVGACSAPPPPASATPAPAASFEGCSGDRLEPDLVATPVELSAQAEPPEGTLFVSTTYLALTPDPQGQAVFRATMAKLIKSFPNAPGLVAFRFATSQSCLSARTLAVWKDVGSMRAFVNGPEHHAAMRQINTLSRGTSTFTHWSGTMATAQWAHAVEEIAANNGPRM